MRTESYINWVDSLSDEEYLEFIEDYGQDGMRRAYNDYLETLAEDLNDEIKDNEELR